MSTCSNQTIKLILLGNGSVGKSSLIARFVDNGFARVYKQTIGLDFYEKKVLFPRDQRVILQVWDIGGQNINSKMFDKYVFAAHVVFICYDVTDLQSFSDAEDWFRLVENGSRNLDFKRMHQYLVGNKIDLVAQRVVSSEKHDEFIRKHKMNSGFLVSARNGDNVLKAVYRVAAEAARIQVTEYELSFCDSIIRTTLSLDGECDSARTAMADQIEAEDLAAEKSKQSAFQSGCLCSIM